MYVQIRVSFEKKIYEKLPVNSFKTLYSESSNFRLEGILFQNQKFKRMKWLTLNSINARISSCLHNNWSKQIEPRYEKTGFLHMRKQRCRSAAQ